MKTKKPERLPLENKNYGTSVHNLRKFVVSKSCKKRYYNIVSTGNYIMIILYLILKVWDGREQSFLNTMYDHPYQTGHILIRVVIIFLRVIVSRPNFFTFKVKEYTLGPFPTFRGFSPTPSLMDQILTFHNLNKSSSGYSNTLP